MEGGYVGGGCTEAGRIAENEQLIYGDLGQSLCQVQTMNCDEVEPFRVWYNGVYIKVYIMCVYTTWGTVQNVDLLIC